jgi:cyclohexanecarboxylate-CoA ligase
MDSLSIDTTGKTLWQLIAERAELTPGKQMARDTDGRTMTFGDYHRWCERTAAGFAALGVAEGSVISWVLPSRLESLVVVGALARLGAVQNPILPIYRHREVGFITKQCGAMLLVTPSKFRGFDYAAMADEIDVPATLVVDDRLPEGDDAVLPPYRPAFEDLRWIFYSSGTTADPKGAKHSDRSLSAANDGMQWSMEVTGDDRAAVVFPITHVGGLVWLFNTMQTGVELLMVETFDPATTPQWLSANGCTCAGAGTAFWLVYLNAQRNAPDGTRILPDVRIFNGGGAPKPDHLHAEMVATFGAPLINGWGLTESPINTMVHVDDPDDKKATTDGRACGGARLRTVLDGVETEPGVEGELQVLGPQVCSGYVDASLDGEAFTPDGWFRTGDLGVIDSEGYVKLTGRLKDIIIRKGENISAKEIEDLLYEHPAVADVAVVGVPDSERGERACAVVVLAPESAVTLDELTSFLRDHRLSAHKLPEQLEIVEALPRNPTGKVLKRELRANLGAPA